MKNNSTECVRARSSVRAVLCIGLGAALFWAPSVFSAQDAVLCPADRMDASNICTSADVNIATAIVGQESEGALCFPGEQFQVDIDGSATVRNNTRYDVTVWVSSDGKPIRETSGANGTTDTGGPSQCEVTPLLWPHRNDTDEAAMVDDFVIFNDDGDLCAETEGKVNNDLLSDVPITTDGDNVINGRLDIDNNGTINGDDDDPIRYHGVINEIVVIDGGLDLNNDGVIDGADDGTWWKYAVIDGEIDVDGDGTAGEVNGDDDETNSFNDRITLTCIAGPNGGLVLSSMVTWQNQDPGVCDVYDPDTFILDKNRCSVNDTEIDIDIVGRVTIVKSAPTATGENFGFIYTNDQPTQADTDVPDNIPNVSVTSPFSLMHSESAEIYAVIANSDGGGGYQDATIVITEDNLPSGWQLGGISCTGDSVAASVVDLPNNRVTVTLRYDATTPADSQDDVTCTFNNIEAVPELTLDKTTTTPSYDDSTDVISYFYDVSNTGNIPLAFPVTVSDSKTTVTCPPNDGGSPNNGDAILDPGESITCSATYDVTQADIDAGSVTNVATATAAGTQSNPDSVTVDAIRTLTLSVVKSSPIASISAPGSVAYSYLVTNTGNVTLTGISLSDDNDEDDMSCPATSLAPGAQMTCTATHNVTQGEIDANGSPVADSGLLTNVVTATSNEAPPAQDQLDIPIAQSPSLDVVKTGTWNDDGSTTGIAEAGETISYTITVDNDGNVTLLNVTVTDPTITANGGSVDCGGGSNVIASLAPTDPPVNCTATYTIALADINNGQVDNTATATSGSTSDSDSETVNLPSVLGLTLVKTGAFNDDITGDGFAQVGETITYTFDVTNDSSITVNNVSVTDPLVSPITCPGGNPIPSMTPGQTLQCSGTYTLTQDDVDAGQVDNTATADSDDTDPTTDDETVILNQNIDWAITKTGVFQDDNPPDGSAQPGETILYTFAVQNTGFVTLTNVAVTDPKVSPIDCDGDNVIDILAPSATVNCTGSYTITQADIDAGQVLNTGTGDPDQTPPESDDEIVDLPQEPATMTIVKSSATTQVVAPDLVFYSYFVTNTSSVSLTGISLSDDNDDDDMSCPSTTLAPGASMTCSASHTVLQSEIDDNGSPTPASGLLENTVTGTANELSSPVTDDLDIPIVQQPGMLVEKTSTTFEVRSAGPVTYNYRVVNTGNVTLNGLTLVDDNIDGAVDCGGVDTLAPGDDLFCSAVHTVTEGELDAEGSPVPGSGVLYNLVTATSREIPDGVTDDLSIPIASTDLARFEVYKLFMDGNDVTPVTLKMQCNDGLPSYDEVTVVPPTDLGQYTHSFTVTNFKAGELDCTIWEEPVSGYTPSYECGNLPGTATACSTGDPSPLDDNGLGPCEFEDVDASTGSTARHFCTIRNYPAAVTATVNKEWILPNAGGYDVPLDVRITLYCDSMIRGGTQDNGYWFSFGTIVGDGSLDFDVVPNFPTTACWAFETVSDSSVEQESDCGSEGAPGIILSAGNPDSCTFTNTLFFEGIPTLSQWGMALMALLMLGVGLVGFRRFA